MNTLPNEIKYLISNFCEFNQLAILSGIDDVYKYVLIKNYTDYIKTEYDMDPELFIAYYDKIIAVERLIKQYNNENTCDITTLIENYFDIKNTIIIKYIFTYMNIDILNKNIHLLTMLVNNNLNDIIVIAIKRGIHIHTIEPCGHMRNMLQIAMDNKNYELVDIFLNEKHKIEQLFCGLSDSLSFACRTNDMQNVTRIINHIKTLPDKKSKMYIISQYECHNKVYSTDAIEPSILIYMQQVIDELNPL